MSSAYSSRSGSRDDGARKLEPRDFRGDNHFVTFEQAASQEIVLGFIDEVSADEGTGVGV